ncbi:MAG TPA: hypothetical protein VGB32_03725 [Candidatus Bathyarchaeia archaeon]|jgi:hypothetical protein
MDEHRRRRKDFPEDPEYIAEVLDTVSDKVPKMIRGILDSFFSPEAAANMAKSVAEFRRTLIENGIPEAEAMAMTREYMQTVTNWKGLMKDARIGAHFHEDNEE